MLEFAHFGPLPSLRLVVNHDDEQREYAYGGAALTNPDAEDIAVTAERFGWPLIFYASPTWSRVFDRGSSRARRSAMGPRSTSGGGAVYSGRGCRPAFRIGPHAVTNAEYERFSSPLTGYVDRGRAPARPRRLPGAPPENLQLRLARVHAYARAGRPAAHQPVVVGGRPARRGGTRKAWNLDSRGTRAASRGPRRLRGRGRSTPPWKSSFAASPRPAGSVLRAATSTTLLTSWVTSPKRLESDERTTAPRRLSLRRPDPGYGTTAPVGLLPPNALGSTTWRATCGNGRPTGTPPPPPPPPPPPKKNPPGSEEGTSLDPGQPQFQCPAPGGQGRVVPVRRQLLPALPPAARRPQMVDTGMSHIGFRCVSD